MLLQYASDLHIEFPANKEYLKEHPLQPVGDVLNEAFAVELHDLIETSGIACWVYGRHHSNTPEFSIGNTKLLTNQLGYVQRNEHGLFETNKVIEL